MTSLSLMQNYAKIFAKHNVFTQVRKWKLFYSHSLSKKGKFE